MSCRTKLIIVAGESEHTNLAYRSCISAKANLSAEYRPISLESDRISHLYLNEHHEQLLTHFISYSR